MNEVGMIILSLIKKVTFGWNIFWWNYHLNQAREHDRRNELIKPGWRDSFQKTKLQKT